MTGLSPSLPALSQTIEEVSHTVVHMDSKTLQRAFMGLCDLESISWVAKSSGAEKTISTSSEADRTNIEIYWGNLIEPDGTGSRKLRSLLLGLFNHIVSLCSVWSVLLIIGWFLLTLRLCTRVTHQDHMVRLA